MLTDRRGAFLINLLPGAHFPDSISQSCQACVRGRARPIAVMTYIYIYYVFDCSGPPLKSPYLGEWCSVLVGIHGAPKRSLRMPAGHLNQTHNISITRNCMLGDLTTEIVNTVLPRFSYMPRGFCVGNPKPANASNAMMYICNNKPTRLVTCLTLVV